MTNERLAVLVTSPDLNEEHLLGVPRLSGGHGQEILEGLVQLLQDWGITGDHIVGMCYDTTVTNTGVNNGVCITLENHLGHQLLYLACRHHILELHVKHVANSQRPTKGNEDILFKKFRDNWNEVIEGGIDYTNLCMFD